MKRIGILVSCFLLMATVIPAQELYIAAAAHSGGVGGTAWRSDLEIKARQGSASFTIELLEERRRNANPLSAGFTIDEGQSLRLGDVVGGAFAFEGTAAIRITATEGDILATSRTFNADPEGTYGQYIPAQTLEDAAVQGFDYSLLQLTRTAGFRTNLGLLNISGFPIEVEVDLYTSAGVFLGTVSYSLRDYELWFETEIFDEVTSSDVEEGYAMVRTRDEGGAFLAYASVIDNASGDAIFIPAQLDGPTEVEVPERFVVFEAFMRHG